MRRATLTLFNATLLLAGLLSACSPPAANPAPPQPPPARNGFPLPDRPVASVVSTSWSSQPNRDAADESGQLIRGLGIRPGMAVADIGAGSGYHSLRLSPAVGPRGVVYSEDIVASYLSGLRREARGRGLANIRIVVGAADDPKLARGSIDRAVMVHMYHEIASPYGLLWRLAPALRRGGQVGVIDVDRPSAEHGMSPALLRCEFEAVGYRHVATHTLEGGVGYLAIFEPPLNRPKPAAIQPCKAP